MDSVDKQKLDQALDLAEENNLMLRKMVRNMRFARLFKIVYWIIIISISLGALFFVQPYVNQILAVYGNIQDAAQSVNSLFIPKVN